MINSDEHRCSAMSSLCFYFAFDLRPNHFLRGCQGTAKLLRKSFVGPVACWVPCSFANAQVPEAKCWISASWKCRRNADESKIKTGMKKAGGFYLLVVSQTRSKESSQFRHARSCQILSLICLDMCLAHQDCLLRFEV